MTTSTRKKAEKAAVQRVATKQARKAAAAAPAPTAAPTPAAPLIVVADTHELWSGRFGNEYHERNRVAWQERVEFWQSAIEYCTPATVFELGCGPGWNLMAIQKCAPNTDLYGADLNLGAVNEARAQGFEVHRVDGSVTGLYEPGCMDLVFTAGCLIHVPPADLKRTMEEIVQLSARYVLAVEYHANFEEDTEYRGHTHALWRRPYGKLYEEMGLTLLSEGVAWNESRCAYWLLEKPQ